MLSDRPEIERKLRVEVGKARAEFIRANEEFERQRQLSSDLGLTHPDGGTARAAKAYRLAAQKYSQALERLADVMLRRSKPDAA